MSLSVKKRKIQNQKADQHEEQDNFVKEHLEEGSPRLCQAGFLVNLSSKSEIERSSTESESRNASVSFPISTIDNVLVEQSTSRGQGNTPICNAVSLRTPSLNDSTLQKNPEKLDKNPSTSTETEFMISDLITTESDTHKACNSKEPDKSSPLPIRTKISSSPTNLHQSSSEIRYQDSPLGFGIRSNPKKIKFCDMAAETSILEDNFSEDINLTLSSDMLIEDSSNQLTTEPSDSTIPISSVAIQQSPKCTPSLDFLNEVKSVYEQIFNNIECFITSPTVNIQTMRQYLSRKRQFVAHQNSQLRSVKLETIQRIASCITSRIIQEINALKHCDTESTVAGSSRECAQSSKEIAPSSVAESSLRKPLLDQNLKKRIVYLHMDLVDDLKMLREFANLVLREYSNESAIDFEKIFDYILCFKIMKEDFSKKIKRFETIKKDAKLDKEWCNYEKSLIHVQYLIKIIENYIAKVQYGIFIVKTHEKLYKEVEYTSANIRHMIKIHEFRTKNK